VIENRLLRWPAQGASKTIVGTARDAFEHPVREQERVPERLARTVPQPLDDPALQLGDALAFPELVRERNQQVFELDVGCVPLGVRDTEAGRFPDAVVVEERAPVGFVPVAGSVHLVRVEDLAGVVERRPHEDELPVDPAGEVAQVIEDLLRGFGHQGVVPHQPMGSAESLQQAEGRSDVPNCHRRDVRARAPPRLSAP